MAGLMAGKRGLIMGVANDHSIAWGIAQALHRQGAELAFTYQGAAFERRVRPLAETVGSSLVLPCDVEQESDIAGTFALLGEAWSAVDRSEEHTSELQSLMRISYAVFCLKI